MWITIVTSLAILWVCSLYVWEAYDFSQETEEPPESPQPVEFAGWDSLLGLKTSEFDRHPGD